MSPPLQQTAAVHTLDAVNHLLPLLRAVLPLALFGLWLLPSVASVEADPVVRGVHQPAPAVAADLASLTPGGLAAGELDPPPPRAVGAAPPTSGSLAPPRRAPTLSPIISARSRGPLYRVRRSGQAHRSAP